LTLLLTTLIIIILVAFSLILVASFSDPLTTQNASKCYPETQSNLIAIAYSLLLILEIELVILTVISAIRKHWQTKSLLARTLIQHKFFYFACGLASSIINVVTLAILKYGYNGMFVYAQFVLHSVLATRMHRKLWMTDTRERDEMVTITGQMSDLRFQSPRLTVSVALYP